MAKQRGALSRAEANAVLRRLVEAGALRPETRLARLLDYLLTAEWQGRGDRLKAYSVAVDVLERGEDFDPTTDAIVRVEIGRLRKLLAEFYAGPGKSDPLIVDIPKGRMRPRITRPEAAAGVETPAKDAPETAPARANVRLRLAAVLVGLFVVVLGGFLAIANILGTPELGEEQDVPIVEVGPFSAEIVDSNLAVLVPGLRGELVRMLSRFHTLRVRDNPDGATLLPEDMRKADFRVTARGRSDATGLMLDFTVTDVASNTIAWSGTEIFRGNASALERGSEQQLSKVILTIAAPNGLVAREALNRLEEEDNMRASSSPSAYACYLRFHAWDLTKDPGQRKSVRACLDELIAQDTQDGLIWSAYGFFTFFDWTERGGDLGAPDFVRAEAAARRAVALAPLASEPHEFLGGILDVSGRIDEADEYLRTALRLNSSKPEIKVRLGWHEMLKDNWEDGLALVQEGIDQSINVPGWFRLPLAFDAIRRGDWQLAGAEGERILAGGDRRGRVIVIAASRELGDTSKLEIQLDAFRNEGGRSLKEAYLQIERFFPNSDVTTPLSTALKGLAPA